MRKKYRPQNSALLRISVNLCRTLSKNSCLSTEFTSYFDRINKIYKKIKHNRLKAFPKAVRLKLSCESCTSCLKTLVSLHYESRSITSEIFIAPKNHSDKKNGGGNQKEP